MQSVFTYLQNTGVCTCMHVPLCVSCINVCALSSVCVFMGFFAPFYVCMSGLIVSDGVASSLNKLLLRGGSTYYLSNCLGERKTGRDRRREGEGCTQHLSFNSETNNFFLKNCLTIIQQKQLFFKINLFSTQPGIGWCCFWYLFLPANIIT